MRAAAYALTFYRSSAHIQLTDAESDAIIHGATEKDLAHSGLEDTMINALEQILETAREKNVSLRMAAWINSINKVAKVSSGRGLFHH